MINKFKIINNKYKKGGIGKQYDNSSDPVGKTVKNPAGSANSRYSSNTEFQNTHGCPLVVVRSHRNGGENDLKTMIGASEENNSSPNEDQRIIKLINNVHHWTKYKNTYQAEADVNSGRGVYVWMEVNKIHGIQIDSKIAYVGMTTRSLGERSKEHYFKHAKQNFHTWLGQVEKNGKLMIQFKSFPNETRKSLEKIEYYFIQKLNPIFNIKLNNGGKKYVR